MLLAGLDYAETVQIVQPSESPVVDRDLKTRKVAELFGVSVSTVKRWVDSEKLPARRTPGGHRLFSAAKVARFAAEHGLAIAAKREDGEAGIEDRGRAALGTWEDLADALSRGRSRAARHLIIEQSRRIGDPAELADHWIRPAMASIGRAWERRAIEIYQEHHATRTVEAALQELLRAQSPPRPDRPLAIGATPEGDFYSVSGLLCELTLRSIGWDAINLGPNLPVDSLGRAVLEHRPRLVWLSISHLNDRETFLRQYSAFYRSIAETGAAVILGGPALCPALRSRMVAASLGDRMSHLREFALRLAPTAGWPPSTSSSMEN